MVKNEKTLLLAFSSASKKVDELNEQLKDAKMERDQAEASLIEWLESQDATTTAKYDGLGYARMMQPRLYASYLKENENTVFDWLKSIERTDMIKESVSGLNSFIGELLESGKKVPEFVTYYIQQKVQVYNK